MMKQTRLLFLLIAALAFAPSHNTRSVGQEKTKWYQATH